MCGYAEGKGILERHLSMPIQYKGFDYSQTLIKEVRERNPEIDVTWMDIRELRAKELYDLVILIGGLHHVPDFSSDAVRRIFESLKDGGYFISFEPTQTHFVTKKIRALIYKRNSLFSDDSEKAFDLADLNRSFVSAGFRLRDQIYPGLVSYVLYYNPDAFPFLNIGNAEAVKALFRFDSLFFRNGVGRQLSFATLTFLQKT
jgi:SAM-dependent methyltransferase